jgi:hypothetical protein
MGEYMAHRTADIGAGRCSSPIVLVADDSSRDLQSAEAFASGFYPQQCAEARAAQIIVANASNGLLPITSDDFEVASGAEGCGTGPSEAEAEHLFGGSTQALTDLYRPQMERITRVLGCCTPELCSKYGIGPGNCTIADLPYAFDGTYYKGLYEGALFAASTFAQAWMMQALSGLPFAYGQLSREELMEIYRIQMRVDWLGTSMNRSQATGSTLLAFLLASLDQVVAGVPLDGAAAAAHQDGHQDGSSAQTATALPRIVALFAHDFNLLYLRQLLGVSWLTDSWQFNVPTTGSSISLELHRDAHTATGYRVLGILTAASYEQQAAASSLVPPHEPPGRAVFLDEPYDAFKARALAGLKHACVAGPLHRTIEQIAYPRAWLQGATLGMGAALVLILGCAFGYASATARARRKRRGNASADAMISSPTEAQSYTSPSAALLLGEGRRTE